MGYIFIHIPQLFVLQPFDALANDLKVQDFSIIEHQKSLNQNWS